MSQPEDESAGPEAWKKYRKLHGAAREGKLAFVRRLLANGVSPRLHDSDGTTALHAAAMRGHVAIIDALLVAGADPDAATQSGFRPIDWGAREGRVDVIEALAAGGADLARYGNNALVSAIRRGHAAAALALLERGAFAGASDENGSALTYALDKGADEVVRALLERGAEPNADVYERALAVAARHGRVEWIDALLAAGADVRGAARHGWTALHAAAYRDQVEAVARLLRAGAELEAATNEGCTPLLTAAWDGATQAARALLAAGANALHRDAEGRNALTLARWNAHEQTADALREAGVAAQPEFDSAIEAVRQQREQEARKKQEVHARFEAKGGRRGKVIAGAWVKFAGQAAERPDGKLDVLIELFGRQTEVVLTREQFEFDP